jgi:hypothetical protein
MDDEDGGWLGPAPDLGPPPYGDLAPAPDDSRTRPAPPPYPRRFDDGGPARRRRALPALVASLVAVTVVAVAVAAALALAGNGRPRTAAPAPTAATGEPPAGVLSATIAPGAPGNLRLEDRGTTITVRWTDPSGGAVPFIVTGRTADGQPLSLRQVRRAVTSVRYEQLDPDLQYCFLVTAVYSSTDIAPSGWTCTRR